MDRRGPNGVDWPAAASRVYTPAVVNGENVYHTKTRFFIGPSEGFYGLGQHQSGVFNYRGNVVELAQANTDVAMPLLLSTNGYGILWNTASHSWFDNRFPTEMTLSAKAADAIDYYFLYGPEFDQIIHEYRDLTGHAPLFGKWAYGFVQSKDRYKSAKELLDVAQEYRDHHVPLDFIVQDWFWWKLQGDPVFNEEYLKPYPDVPGALQKLHDEHFHAMISVWAMLDPKSETYQEMKAEGPDHPRHHHLRRDQPGGARLLLESAHGQDVRAGLGWLLAGQLRAGVLRRIQRRDARQRATLHRQRRALHQHLSADAHRRRLRALARDHRPQARLHPDALCLSRPAAQCHHRLVRRRDRHLLRRSSTRFPPASTFELSGMPYWTTDIAGYGWPYERDTRDPVYQELYTRWYEFGVFCPIFRTHGHRSNDTNEIFSYGPQTPTLIAYDKLRYRLLPYIYSLAWRVTSDDYTIMRPLVMDWRTDPKVRDIGDEYLFGPAILVNPVTQREQPDRPSICRPRRPGTTSGPARSSRATSASRPQAPLDRIPLYVKAGSILPLGPEVEYATAVAGCAHRTAHLSRRRRRLHLLQRRGRHLRLRKGRACHHSAPLGRCSHRP